MDKDENEAPEKDTSKYEDFDILEIIGSQDKFQNFLLYFVLCPIITVQPIFTLNALFMLYQPGHWCHVPGRNNETELATWKNHTIPKELGVSGNLVFSKCYMYDSNRSIVSCQYGWEYDNTDYDVTIPSQFDWVCDKDTYATDALTFYAVGNCIGTLVFGWSADKFGRKPIYFLTLFINTFFRIVSLFIPQSYLGFLAVQLIVGTAFPIMYIVPSMIVAELSAKDDRGWIYAVTWMIWVLGLMSLPLIAWLIRNWFIIGLVTSAPGILLFLYYWFLPESPRWLLSVGQYKKAAHILEMIASANGTSHKISHLELESRLKKIVLRTDQPDPTKKTGIWTLFTDRQMGINTILVTIAWSLNGIIYYGVTLNSSYMSGNQFLNFFLLAVIELPSGYIGGILVEKAGRRWTHVAFFFAGAFAFIAAAIAVSIPGLNGLSIASIIIGKFCITLTFLVVYLQAAELFPTELRSTGSGFASTVASAVGIGAPYLVFLGKYNIAAPYLPLAGLSLLGVMITSFLPETLNQNLPESMDDAVKFGKGVKFWSFLPPARKESLAETDDNKK